MADGADGKGCDIRQLVADFHQDVYRFAYRLSGSAADADDLSQQTFLLAQQKLQQLRERDKAKSWLLSITRTLFLKMLRKQKPAAAVDLNLDMGSFYGEFPSENDFDQELLQKAISELPDEFRLVLMMFYFEDLPYKQIAEQLELPAGTVMSRLSRAKSHLRKKLSVDEVPSKQAAKA